MAENIKLSPPWITFVHEIEAMFKDDNEVKVKYDDANQIVKLYVDDSDKAMALGKLIPVTKTFGNVTLKIEVIPPNVGEYTETQLFDKAFAGNPAMSYAIDYETPFGHMYYVIFRKEVIQFFNDQFDDINGNKSTLLQDIAKDIFGEDHSVFYCTETNDKNLTKPLGEWP